MDSKVFFHVNKLNTLGDYIKRPSNRPITRRAYREFEYMPNLQYKNPIKEMFVKMAKYFKSIINTKK